MTRVDASFGPAIQLGWQRERLPVVSEARVTYSDSTEIDAEGYTQVFPAVAGASVSPFSPGEWVPISVTYTGSFSYATIRKGRKRSRRLRSGTVYATESWYNDEYWVETSGFAVPFFEFQAASSSTASLLAFESKLLSGADSIIGSDFNDWINAWGGSDSIDGGNGDDIIYGGDGDDTIRGGAGRDVIRGDNGSDRYLLTQGEGYPTIYGYEKGIDIIDASALYFPITTRLDNGNLWIYADTDAVAVLVSTPSL